MRPLRKNLARIVVLMCAFLVLCFVSILLNGTLFFYSDSSEKNASAQTLDNLILGEPQLRRIDKQLAWVTYLGPTQRTNLTLLTGTQVEQEKKACQILQDYCILLAETEQSGVSLQYTAAPPAQLPNELLWFGGFVNPVDGSVYDLLGRAYLYQGPIDPLVVIQLN